MTRVSDEGGISHFITHRVTSTKQNKEESCLNVNLQKKREFEGEIL